MPHLSIRTLGALVVTLDSQVVTSLAYDKVWALLVYLAQAPDHPHRRESLAGLLWPDQLDEQARTNLRQALTRLRKAIGDSTATPPFLLIERNDIQFNAAGNHALDTAEFTALLAACAVHAHRHAETCAACAAQREQAIALYHGPFLDKFYIGDSDLFEEWATVVRERLHQQALDALAALIAYHERRGNYAQALRYSERLLELDPWREEAYRHIMRILTLNGRRSAALQCYERCRALLAQELGVEPAHETTALYEQIRAAELGAPGKMVHLALPTQHRHNLPPQPTPFVGREQELGALADLLADPQCRLITLLGPGGIGKTRLALQTAANESETFPDGTLFVSLAALDSAELITPTVAAAVGLTLANHPSPTTELLHYLHAMSLLLVLDNFEHLLTPPTSSRADEQNGDEQNGGATALLTGILTQAPGVKLLVTSRERLNIQGEWVFDVGGLETPVEPYDSHDLDAERIVTLEGYSAVALFLQTARRVRQGFSPTAADRAAIVHICQLVQGMPLALELAAAWVRVLPCREIAQEIAKSMGFLATTLRDLPARHRSLQAVFDHSWKLLTAAERQVYAACSVFRGGFTREAAAEVAGASLPLLAALVDKSLLRRDLNGRYEIHELARQYAADRLVDAQENTRTRHRHLIFFMRLAEEAEPQILGGKQVAQWHDWVEIEHDNIRAALDWSLTGGEVEPGLRIVGALWYFWMNRGYAPEGQRQAERFLARPEMAAPTEYRGKALHTAAVCAFYHDRYDDALVWAKEGAAIGLQLGQNGRYVRAIALIVQGYTLSALHNLDAMETLSRESLRLGQELQVGWIEGDALNQLADIAWQRGDAMTAHRRLLEALETFQAAGEKVMEGIVLRRIGTIRYQQGDYAAAHGYLQESLAIAEEVNDRVRITGTLTQLGLLAAAQGNAQEAQAYFVKALSTIRDTGHLRSRIRPIEALGRLAQQQGNTARAHALHQESLALAIEIKNPAWTAYALKSFACLMARQGQAETAVQLFAAAEALIAPLVMRPGSLEAQFEPVWRPEHDRLLAEVRTQLGEAAFAAAWATGAALTLDEAVALIQHKADSIA